MRLSERCTLRSSTPSGTEMSVSAKFSTPRTPHAHAASTALCAAFFGTAITAIWNGCSFDQASINGEHRDFFDRRAAHGGIGVEHGGDGKADVGEAAEGRDGRAEAPGADDYDMMPLIEAENGFDRLAQRGNLIPASLTAETAKGAEILADLRIGQPHFLAEGAGGNILYAALFQQAQMTIVGGKAARHGVGNALAPVIQASHRDKTFHNKLSRNYPTIAYYNT